MRLIAGRYRGRPIAVPARAPGAAPLRPSSDRLRQAVFNILDHGCGEADYAGQAVVDVFAGTGAYGLEALSRGAAFATFIELDPGALAGIRRTVTALGEHQNTALLRLDATRLPAPPRIAATPAALAFLDPPYGADVAGTVLNSLRARGWLRRDALAVVEVAAAAPFAPPPDYQTIDERTYGAGRVVFLRLRTAATSTR